MRINGLAAVITVIEIAVLVQWLRLTTTAAAAVAAGFLFIGILAEELVRFRGVKGRFPQGKEFTLVALGVAVEAAGWIVPVVFRLPLPQTIVVLFLFLEVEHSIIRLATNGDFNLAKSLDFSAIEALGGAIWLVDPNAGTLAVMIGTSLGEHVQGIRQGFGLR